MISQKSSVILGHTGICAGSAQRVTWSAYSGTSERQIVWGYHPMNGIEGDE